jgi:hypothetical protein
MRRAEYFAATAPKSGGAYTLTYVLRLIQHRKKAAELQTKGMSTGPDKHRRRH